MLAELSRSAIREDKPVDVIRVLTDLIQDLVDTMVEIRTGEPCPQYVVAWLSGGADKPEYILVNSCDTRQAHKQAKIRKHIFLYLVNCSGAGGTSGSFGHTDPLPRYSRTNNQAFVGILRFACRGL
jgi:hypothetical protein